MGKKELIQHWINTSNIDWIKLKVKKTVLLELHTCHVSETVDIDPFIGEILSHGIPIKVA